MSEGKCWEQGTFEGGGGVKKPKTEFIEDTVQRKHNNYLKLSFRRNKFRMKYRLGIFRKDLNDPF